MALHTIGIIGAGQLGQMLGLAASKLGMTCVFLDPADDPPAAIVGNVIKAAFDDAHALARLADACDVITYEFENVPVAAIRMIESHCPVYPPPQALEMAQDRLSEKQLFRSLDIPIPGFSLVDSEDDLLQAAATLGFPLLVKTRRFGYDGRGQAVFRSGGNAEELLHDLGKTSLIAEQYIEFDYEISAIGARGVSGEIVTYALTENEHQDGILRSSRAPAAEGELTTLARDYLNRLLVELRYVGVLALELFVTGDELLANEFAPRVHNSGHWTIEGASASQFENHIRAISAMPLADPKVIGFPGMVNLIGAIPFDSEGLAGHSVFLHDYGKVPRPGRKLGHVTVIGDNAAQRDIRLRRLQARLSK